MSFRPWAMIHLTQTCRCQFQGSVRTMLLFSILSLWEFSLCSQHSREKGGLEQLTVRHSVLSKQCGLWHRVGHWSAGQHSAAACRDQRSTAAHTQVFGTNLLVCTKVQILFLLLFYMTQSCCYTLYFNTAPCVGAKTQESECSCIPGFYEASLCT